MEGPVYLSKLNLAGDQQADLSVHGGADKAVNVYPQEHYRYWNQRARFPMRKRIQLPQNLAGAFGENFTTSGFTERDVCIGDTFQIGEAVVQISQPRQPCWKLARKFNQQNFLCGYSKPVKPVGTFELCRKVMLKPVIPSV